MVTGNHKATLSHLLVKFENAAPGERISFRDPVLAYGASCIGPLRDLAVRKPALGASVASWLGVLVQGDPNTKAEVARALADLSRLPDSSVARSVLERITAKRASAPGRARPKAPVKRTAEAEVHARILKAAREGRILVYSDLQTSRGHVGRYLHNIALVEAAADHPPLTAIVVGKATGRPGDGFLPAMVEAGYAHRGETLEAVWHRAVADVFAYWATPSGAPLRDATDA